MTVGSIFGNAISAILANQRALATVSHNIANVNTEGFNRQRVEFVTRPPQASAAGFIGSGVETAGARRITDELLNTQLRVQTSLVEQYKSLHDLLGPVDKVVGDTRTGLSTALQEFFQSIDEMTADPTSPAGRAVVIEKAQSLAGRFNGLHATLQNARDEVNGRIKGLVNEINGLAGAIARTNDAVLLARGQAPTQPPNDILDQRDELIRRLAEITSVATVVATDGTVSVSVGNGQQLVLGTGALPLQATASAFDSSRLEINVAGGNPITDTLQGGQLGGVLAFRDEALDPVTNQLGLIATGLGQSFNAQHRLGMDLNGDFGGDFFAISQAQVLAHPANTATASPTVTIADVASLTAADYQLGFDGGAWTLTNLQTGQPVTLAGSGTAADPFVADGLRIEVAGIGAAADDRFLIQPTRSGARDFSLAITSPNGVAAALPIRATTANGNLGDVQITELALDATGSLPLSANGGDIVLTFDPNAMGPGSPGFALTGGPGGAIAFDPATDNHGKSFTLGAPFDGISFTIRGRPSSGDSLTIADNSGGIGDNRNALLLAGLQTAPTLSLGTDTYAGAYNSLVSSLAVATQRAATERDVQQSVLDFSTNRRDSISGVNLDEEAADLMRFQLAYQAASRVIVTANELFQELLGAVRR